MIFREKPDDFENPLIVAGCFIEVNGEILLLRRNSEKPGGNTWGTPGGKQELKDNNDLLNTIIRESDEETQIYLDKKSLQKIDQYYVIHKGKKFIYHKYRIILQEKPEVKINFEEHSEHIWVKPQVALTLDLIEDEDFVIKDAYKIP